MTKRKNMSDIKSKNIELVDIDSIIPNPKNANRHSIEQIKRLEKLIKYQGFRNPLIVSNRTGFLVVGHGRLEAAKNLGMNKVPVIYQDFKDEAQEYAYLISDNEIARWAELDMHSVYTELKEIEIDDVEMLGLEHFEIPDVEDLIDDEKYTRKVESPIYEPSGDKPNLKEIYDTDKYYSLINEIDKSDLEESEKVFLRFAAARHIKFNYKYIAEYYAHSDAKLQNLMENSALVIIDFDKAIEQGFVKLTEKGREAYQNDKQ